MKKIGSFVFTSFLMSSMAWGGNCPPLESVSVNCDLYCHWTASEYTGIHGVGSSKVNEHPVSFSRVFWAPYEGHPQGSSGIAICTYKNTDGQDVELVANASQKGPALKDSNWQKGVWSDHPGVVCTAGMAECIF